ncbi:ABC transporter permease [Nitrincola iocasae]|uniref:ABC transporter permease n=1 Tax=Nitrincola iocasae TaxID=2614693 RepID=A0A5J6LA16_9GAMM|nr:ABC transporter permease [Nitrincola iocasae]QEW05345.1 ABC transporter permease [Nitrincola iocasae]
MLALALRSLWNRRGTAALTLLTLAISVLLLTGVEKLRQDARQGFFNTVAGTDLIVGARSGSLPLLLYSVFNIGQPTNNVRWSSYEQIAAQDQVAWSIPITLGDSHRGFRVVGTTEDYFRHYRFGKQQPLSFSQGDAFDDLFDVVVGAEVAGALEYSLGDKLTIAHGLGQGSFAKHDDMPFTVSGILQPTGTPVDRNVLIKLEAWEAIHLGWRAGTRIPGLSASQDDAREMDLTPKQITAFLLGLESPISTFHLQRSINTFRAEPLQAILPGVAIQELWQVMAVAERTLLIISGFVVFAGFTGMLGILLTSLNERRRELAVLRAVGAGPLRIVALLLFEAMLLTFLGILLGLLLLTLLTFGIQDWLALQYGIFLNPGWPDKSQWLLLGAVQLAGLLTGLIPAWRAYRYTLADGLTPRL